MASPVDQLKEKIHSANIRLKENSHRKGLEIEPSQTKAYQKQENLLAENTKKSFHTSLILLRKTAERLEADLRCLTIQASVAAPFSYEQRKADQNLVLTMRALFVCHLAFAAMEGVVELVDGGVPVMKAIRDEPVVVDEQYKRMLKEVTRVIQAATSYDSRP